MAGILDPKQRILDVILTENGRRQMRNGTFEIKYASVTDKTAYYQTDGEKLLDISEEIQLEAFGGPQDYIIPEIDETGATGLFARSSVFATDDTGQTIEPKILVRDGKVYNALPNETFAIATGSQDIYSGSFSSIDTGLNNFNNLKIVKTKDEFFNNTQMTFSPSVANFSRAFHDDSQVTNENILNPIIIDSRFRNSLSMQYLPPENQTGAALGAYAKYISKSVQTFDEIESEIESEAQHQLIKIDKSSMSINLLGQIFELGNSSIKKLMLVDAGDFYDETNNLQARVYYAGHILRDSSDIPKFLRVFTLIFKRGEDE
ncbi:MAG: hypothetical protein CBC29_05710 [Methylococcaceae bacterium TMED69]|nr:MAG: hypothetical protein CBC29_05710 [Methylococcaceae bacterium TMED69]